VTFRHLKSNGFNLEEMRVEGKDKKELMMTTLSTAVLGIEHS
jgi:hypothetical protein